MVRLRDPDGISIDVLHGHAKVAPLPSRPAIPHNAPAQTVRVNDTQRPPLAPPEVTKLGHLVLTSPNFPRKVQWYMRMFGFIPSDVLCVPDATPAGAFMRLDRGATPSDHHTLFVCLGPGADIDHAAFEVIDLDAVEVGQQVLKAGGYRHAWGVGRHLLGSQIFDYWRDPWGLKHEHYADGDLFDAHQPTGYHKLDREGLYQWGPDLPDDFVAARPTLAQVASLLRGAMRGDVALRPLIAAARSMRAPGRPWQR
ncbi:MAG TPA: VOC family protein [Acidisphaera sp.]|nr:VOC family protein [Acidisphaera sp.]